MQAGRGTCLPSLLSFPQHCKGGRGAQGALKCAFRTLKFGFGTLKFDFRRPASPRPKDSTRRQEDTSNGGAVFSDRHAPRRTGFHAFFFNCGLDTDITYSRPFIFCRLLIYYLRGFSRNRALRTVWLVLACRDLCFFATHQRGALGLRTENGPRHP